MHQEYKKAIFSSHLTLLLCNMYNKFIKFYNKYKTYSGYDVSSIGTCRPRIFFINEFFCFLEDEWQRNREGRERGDATSKRR